MKVDDVTLNAYGKLLELYKKTERQILELEEAARDMDFYASGGDGFRWMVKKTSAAAASSLSQGLDQVRGIICLFNKYIIDEKNA